MIGKNPSKELLKRLIPALTVLAVEKILEVPKVKAAVKDVDREASRRKRRALRSIETAGKNAARSKALLGASAAAFALGIGLLAKAGSKKK
jgi:hypothetical protein